MDPGREAVPTGLFRHCAAPGICGWEPSVLQVDIGGWTVDLMRLDNAVPNAATCRNLEMGVIRCMDEAMEQIRRRTGLSVTDIQIERVLNGSTYSMDQTTKEMIPEPCEDLYGADPVLHP